jgi:hypothetical protein
MASPSINQEYVESQERTLSATRYDYLGKRSGIKRNWQKAQKRPKLKIDEFKETDSLQIEMSLTDFFDFVLNETNQDIFKKERYVKNSHYSSYSLMSFLELIYPDPDYYKPYKGDEITTNALILQQLFRLKADVDQEDLTKLHEVLDVLFHFNPASPYQVRVLSKEQQFVSNINTVVVIGRQEKGYNVLKATLQQKKERITRLKSEQSKRQELRLGRPLKFPEVQFIQTVKIMKEAIEAIDKKQHPRKKWSDFEAGTATLLMQLCTGARVGEVLGISKFFLCERGDLLDRVTDENVEHPEEEHLRYGIDTNPDYHVLVEKLGKGEARITKRRRKAIQDAMENVAEGEALEEENIESSELEDQKVIRPICFVDLGFSPTYVKLTIRKIRQYFKIFDDVDEVKIADADVNADGPEEIHDNAEEYSTVDFKIPNPGKRFSQAARDAIDYFFSDFDPSPEKWTKEGGNKTHVMRKLYCSYSRLTYAPTSNENHWIMQVLGHSSIAVSFSYANCYVIPGARANKARNVNVYLSLIQLQVNHMREFIANQLIKDDETRLELLEFEKKAYSKDIQKLLKEGEDQLKGNLSVDSDAEEADEQKQPKKGKPGKEEVDEVSENFRPRKLSTDKKRKIPLTMKKPEKKKKTQQSSTQEVMKTYVRSDGTEATLMEVKLDVLKEIEEKKQQPRGRRSNTDGQDEQKKSYTQKQLGDILEALGQRKAGTNSERAARIRKAFEDDGWKLKS